jgi:prepilin-type N-terminal cleavage/methylation domain-containing protein
MTATTESDGTRRIAIAPSRSRAATAPSTAFTLIELLVTVTIIALQSVSYSEYCEKCADAGYKPLKAASFYELRHRQKDKPEFVKGRMGPKTKGANNGTALG